MLPLQQQASNRKWPAKKKKSLQLLKLVKHLLALKVMAAWLDGWMAGYNDNDDEAP